MKKFVIHEHFSKKHHFDLRLELDGVLKSWAIPKGLSYVSDEKHLAILVEDHPLEYIIFEGTIPEGKYGAGEVKIWDSGDYYTTDNDEKKAFEKGSMTIRFKGEKLDGIWKLYKFWKGGEDSWLIQRKS